MAESIRRKADQERALPKLISTLLVAGVAAGGRTHLPAARRSPAVRLEALATPDTRGTGRAGIGRAAGHGATGLRTAARRTADPRPLIRLPLRRFPILVGGTDTLAPVVAGIKGGHFRTLETGPIGPLKPGSCKCPSSPVLSWTDWRRADRIPLPARGRRGAPPTQASASSVPRVPPTVGSRGTDRPPECCR
jgi:hypothetical protein